MIVVGDTSPITALLSIGRIDLLKSVFDEVVVPSAVHDELLQYHEALPTFLRVMKVRDKDGVAALAVRLDRGEAEAISLAREVNADWPLMDETAGRRVARGLGLRVLGLLGVLILARRRGLLPSLRDAILDLRSGAGFYLSNDVIGQALKEVGEGLPEGP